MMMMILKYILENDYTIQFFLFDSTINSLIHTTVICLIQIDTINGLFQTYDKYTYTPNSNVYHNFDLLHSLFESKTQWQYRFFGPTITVLIHPTLTLFICFFILHYMHLYTQP